MQNNIKRYGFILFFFIAQFVNAQEATIKKPTLFGHLPTIVNCPESLLSSLFNKASGETVSIKFAQNFLLEGFIKTKQLKYGKLETLTIQLNGYGKILLAISRRTGDKGNYFYKAHLFDNHYADGYELKRDERNNYRLEKIATETLLPACKQ